VHCHRNGYTFLKRLPIKLDQNINEIKNETQFRGKIMFGRKKVTAPQNIAVPADANYDELDVLLLALGTKFGLNLSVFGQGYILSPKLWEDPVCNEMLSEQGLQSNQRGNVIMLFGDALSVRKLNQSSECSAAKEVLTKAGFGLVPYNQSASNGFNDELTEMQLQTIRGFAAEYRDNANARKNAIWDFHRFCAGIFKGQSTH
jgi:hypothetical protein